MTDKVFVELTLEERKAIQAVVKTEQRIKQFGERAQKNFGKSSQAFNVFIGNLGSRAAFAAFNVLKNGISSVVRESVEFDKALREISTILPKDQKLTDGLAKSLVNLSGEFATSQAKQAKAFYQVISAGVTDTAEAMDVLEASNTLALGGLADLESTINVVTKVLNNYGAEAGDATQITDDLFTAVRLGQTRVEDLALSMPQLLSQAKALGFSFKDVAAALSTVTTLAGNTAEATTNLKAVFTSFTRNQVEVEKVIGRGAIKTLGFQDALKLLIEKTKTSTKLQEVLGGRVQALNGALQLASNNFEAFNRNQNAFIDTSGAAKEAADETSKALDFQWNKFIQGAKNAASALFDFLKPALETALVAANALLEGMDNEKEVGAANRQLDLINTKLHELATNYGVLTLDQTLFQNSLIKEKQRIEDVVRSLGGLTTAQQGAKFAGATGAIDIGGLAGEAAGDISTKAPSEDNRIIFEKKVQEELARLREKENLAASEAAIAQASAQGEFTDANFLRLQEQIGTEQAIKLTAREQENALQTDATKKEIETQKIASAKKIAISKAETKAIIADKKFQQVTSQQILSASLNAIDAFGNLSDAALGKQHALSKAFAIARVGVFTAEGIMRALTLPFPINWIQGAAVAAMGATQLINIKKQRFQNSGILEGSQTGDRNVAGFNDGEMFLDKRLQENLIETLRNPTSGGGGFTMNIQGDLIVDSDDRVDEIAQRLSDAVENRNVKLQASEVRAA